jgi:hypothetical protein
MVADDLIDKYPGALEDMDAARMLLAVAYLEGRMDGADQAVNILREQLETTVAGL